MVNIHDSVASLPKIHPKTIRQLGEIDIRMVEDLLRYFPRRYLDFSKFTLIKDIAQGETVTIKVIIKNIQTKLIWTTKRMMAEAVVSDSSGTLKINWFNQGYMAETLKPGDEVFLAGKVTNYKGPTMMNPIYEKIGEHSLHTGRLVPIYKLPDKLYSRTFRTLVDAALPAAKDLEDILPPVITKKYKILNLENTVKQLHFPTNKEAVEKAQERMAFEEALIQQLAAKQKKLVMSFFAAPNIEIKEEYINLLKKSLPFTLTVSQDKALKEILEDLKAKHPMHRLLMGDTGSGKTIVAFLAALQVIKQNFQVALLAPTEILAKQHFDNLNELNSKFKSSDDGQNITLGLYTSSFQKMQINNAQDNKKDLMAALTDGKINLLVGTHAILEEKLHFKNLAFLIIDEQHRFGVRQRAELLDRGVTTRSMPHLLSMSATPIPRTAGLVLYGDLDMSVIDELPKNRLKVKTWVVPEEKRAGAYEFIKKEIAAGRQAFIITPLVEESEKLQIKSAKAEYLNLQKNIFPKNKLGLIHGQMSGIEKDKTMRDFHAGKIDILVSTSVVEIGIDNPNATVIVIESAERFGLSQLHQLRGRVGRGKDQSFCFLFSSVETSQERLKFFTTTADGFALAEYDLKTRGFGSLFGQEQSGFYFKYPEFLTAKVLKTAKTAADDLTANDPLLAKYPKLLNLAKPLSYKLHLE